MPIPNLRHSLFAICCLLIGSSLAACSAGSYATSDPAPVPITLHDPSPAQLTVSVNVTIGGDDATTHNMTTIFLNFTSQDRLVQFAGHEQLVCNGKALPLHARSDDQQITGPSNSLGGQTFRCTYSAGHTNATLTFTVPHAPILHAPKNQTHLPRSNSTIMTYDTQGETLSGIVALTSSSKAIASLDTPSMGQATLDTSSFSAGAGTIALTETLNVQVTQTGTPFASLIGRGNGVALLDVTWT